MICFLSNCQFLILLYLFCCQELFYEDRHYHEHCFRCFRCDRSLADEPFTSQEDALLCNDCYCNEFSSKCVACDKIVMPGKGSEQLCLERFKCWQWRLFPSVPLYFCFSEVREVGFSFFNHEIVQRRKWLVQFCIEHIMHLTVPYIMVFHSPTKHQSHHTAFYFPCTTQIQISRWIGKMTMEKDDIVNSMSQGIIESIKWQIRHRKERGFWKKERGKSDKDEDPGLSSGQVWMWQ